MGAAPEGTPWDVYREIHKAMRFALASVTTMAGATEAAHPDEVERLVAEWRDVKLVLLGHHGHEDDFCDVHVQAHAPQLRERLEAAHVEADAAIEALDAQAEALLTTPADQRWAAVLAFHLALGDFTAMYLAHLRFEESHVMPALQAAMSNVELEAVTVQIRTSVPPPEMCVFIKYMVPSMNFAERLDMLGGMYQGAPPEIFEMFRAAAEACLPADEYRAVAAAGGFA
jgi:hypothetical protein